MRDIPVDLTAEQREFVEAYAERHHLSTEEAASTLFSIGLETVTRDRLGYGPAWYVRGPQ